MKVIFILFIIIKITFEQCGFNSTFPQYRLEEPEYIMIIQHWILRLQLAKNKN